MDLNLKKNVYKAHTHNMILLWYPREKRLNDSKKMLSFRFIWFDEKESKSDSLVTFVHCTINV